MFGEPVRPEELTGAAAMRPRMPMDARYMRGNSRVASENFLRELGILSKINNASQNLELYIIIRESEYPEKYTKIIQCLNTLGYVTEELDSGKYKRVEVRWN